MMRRRTPIEIVADEGKPPLYHAHVRVGVSNRRRRLRHTPSSTSPDVVAAYVWRPTSEGGHGAETPILFFPRPECRK